MESVTAVIVTYNRLNDLKICLQSLRQQTRQPDKVLVVNNGSTDGTEEWLAQQSGMTVITQANLGGAGGFATGIKAAYEAGSTWLWCMDDDCVPADDALEKLLCSPNIGPCVKNSLSISNKNHDELAFYIMRPNRHYRLVADVENMDLVYGIAFFFNGTLIHTDVIKQVGFPEQKLFIWGDEVEYMTRIQKAGFPVVSIPKSFLYHPPSFDRNGLPWPGAWKQYYAVRNQRKVFQNLHGNTIGQFVYTRWAVSQSFQQVSFKQQNWLYNFLLYCEATVDSMTNNFRKRPHTIFTMRLYKAFNK